AAESARLEAELKTTLANLDFTAIAFAGGEAIATYRVVTEDPRAGGQRVEAGGMIVEDGSGWQVDPTASALLARLPDMRYTVLSKVAGLPDGGAVAAGPGLVIERDSASAPWRFSSQPLPEAQNVSALAAYRDQSGTLRAVVSIDLDPYMNPNHILAPGQGAFAGDLAPPTVPGQPPPYLSADPLPNTGYVLKEVASGWSDMEHMALESSSQSDMPVRPDPVLALLVSPSGGSGLAVGGQTDDTTGSPPEPNFFETAAAMRFGAGDSSAGADAPAPISTPRGQATFAVGGAAACEQACAEFAEDGLAPDALLAHALQMANQIAGSTGGLRGFLYTGDRLLAKSTSLGGEAFQRELTRYATLLGSGSPLPVRASASPNDIAPSGGLGSFLATLEPFVPGAGKAYYSFVSEGSSGSPVKVIVLDYSGEALGPTQQAWLSEQLKAAREGNTPAIVMGNASLGFALPEAIGFNPRPVQAEDAAEVAKILVEGEASAYLFDYPGVNVQTKIRYGARHIPAYGTGTLGYASPPGGAQTDSLGSSGFLLLEVDTAAREPGTSNVAPVNARVEPNIGELALAATDGTLLHRSQVGLFEGLARVPPSGRAVSLTASGRVIMLGPQPYEPIPFDCQGPDCADQVPTDYTFSSSKPDVGGFVAHEPASANPRQVELGPNELPLPDPHSGLFCAYNEGTTVVTITTGGLSYSEPITVQGGSVERPCGTVPLKNPPPKAESVSSGLSIPNSAPLAPTPVTPQIQSLVPPPPPPLPARPPAQRHAHRPSTLPPVPLAPPLLFPLLFLPPLPAPNLARPIPPSGTAPVSQQVGIAEEERERQGATEVSHHMVAYRHPQEGPMPTWPLALIPLAVAAAIALRRGGGSPEPVFAHKPARHVGSPRRPW
ncbi:MAG TPA: hypothetical protein VHS55_08735, partial [Solirubrobacteraceae bacterium]|nr:hypothetical protein [Solirubrobacteraceae bacterium]